MSAPGPVNRGFRQRCWKWLSVSSPQVIPGLWLICGRLAGGIRGGKPRAGFPQGFCLSKRLMPSSRCVRALGSEATVPCAGEARAGMQTTAAAPRDAANPKVPCSGKASSSAGCRETWLHAEGFVYFISSLGCSNTPTSPVVTGAPSGTDKGGLGGRRGKGHLPRLLACPRGAAC